MSAWHNDPFFQYPRTPVKTSKGNVDMPILYYDNSQWMLLFWADLNAARKLVNEELEVVSVRGKALCGVAFYEYRDTSIGSYNEVGIAIGCIPKGHKVPWCSFASILCALDKNLIGFNIVDLPVTTEEACSAGREIWSLPKFVTPIEYQEQGRNFTGIVQHPSNEGVIVRVTGRAGLGIPFSVINLVLYSKHQDQILRTLVNTRGLGMASLGGSLRLTVENTEHPMGNRLAELGLNGQKPLAAIRTNKLQLRLNSGAALPKTL